MQSMKRRVRVAATAILTAASVVSAATIETTRRSSSGRVRPPALPVSTPEAQGMDSNGLAEGIQLLLDNRDHLRVHAVSVARHGHLVAAVRFWPFQAGQRHDLASVTKSLTSTLIGIAIDRGEIAGLDEPVIGFFSGRQIANLDTRKRAMTVGDLLAMRSGLECDPSGGEITLQMMMASPDWVQFALDLPMAETPGERFVYCSPNYHLAAAVLESATGTSLAEYARLYLVSRLGGAGVSWAGDPQGLERGWGDARLEPIDMAAIGELMLDDGVARGVEVVSESWVVKATSPPEGSNPPAGWPPGSDYGLSWVLNNRGFVADGRGYQVIEVFPDEGLVVAINAGGAGDPAIADAVWREFRDDFVLGAILSEEPLPANPGGELQLAAAATAAAQRTDGPTVGPPTLPGTAVGVSGRTIRFDPETSLFHTIRLDFEPGEPEALMSIGMPAIQGGPEFTIRIGLDGRFRFAPGRFGVDAMAAGAWHTDTRFVVDFDEIGLINLWRLTFDFDGNNVILDLESVAGGLQSGVFTGIME